MLIFHAPFCQTRLAIQDFVQVLATRLSIMQKRKHVLMLLDRQCRPLTIVSICVLPKDNDTHTVMGVSHIYKKKKNLPHFN